MLRDQPSGTGKTGKNYDRLEYEVKQQWIAGNMLSVAGYTSKDVVYNCTIGGVGKEGYFKAVNSYHYGRCWGTGDCTSWCYENSSGQFTRYSYSLMWGAKTVPRTSSEGMMVRETYLPHDLPTIKHHLISFPETISRGSRWLPTYLHRQTRQWTGRQKFKHFESWHKQTNIPDEFTLFLSVVHLEMYCLTQE